MKEFITLSLNNFPHIMGCDIEKDWDAFKEIMHSSANKYIPIVSDLGWKKKDSWKFSVSAITKKLINQKHRLWTRFQENRDRQTLLKYKAARNKVRKETRLIQSNYQKEIASVCSSNPKKFWQFINSKTKKFHSLGNIVGINSDGSKYMIENDREKAEEFANFFEKMYTNCYDN